MATSEGGWRVAHGLVLGFALALGASHLQQPPRAMAQQAGGEKMFAVVGAGQGQGSNVLFVIDPPTQRLLVYEHRVGGRLELVTIRNMAYETLYEQWPEQGPRATTPSVKDMRPK